MADLETEIVKIVWDIENPEAAITKLVTRLGEIDAKLGEVAQKAAQFGTTLALSLNQAGLAADSLVGKMERALAGMEAIAARSGSAIARDPLTGRTTSWGAFQQQYGPAFNQQAENQKAIEKLVQAGKTQEEAAWAVSRATGAGLFQAQARLYDPIGMIGASAVGAFLGTSGVDYSAAGRLGGAPIPPSRALVPYGPSLQDYQSYAAQQQAQLAQAANLYNLGTPTGPQLGGPVIPPGMALVPVSVAQAGGQTGAGQGWWPFRGGQQGNWQSGTIPLGPSGFLGGPGGGGGGGGGGGLGGQGGGWNFGPFSFRQFFQEEMQQAQAQGNLQWLGGDARAFERTMQGQFIPAQYQMGIGQAGVGLAGARYAEQQQAGLAGGGTPSQRAFLNTQAQTLLSQQEVARLASNAPEYDKLSKSLEENRSQYEKLGTGIDQVDSRFDRHLLRIAESILVWTAFRAVLRSVEDTIRTAVQEMLRLESVQARVSFISPGVSVAQANIQAAQYGIAPAQAAPGAITAAQLGLGQAQQQQAAQQALIFGADQYNNILQELYQTQIVASASGEKLIDTQEYLATAFKIAPTNIENYYDALQKAYQIHRDLGLSIRQTAFAILEMNKASELTPDTLATTLRYAIGRVGQPEIQKKLETFGIQAGRPEAMIRDIAAEVDRLVSSGNAEKAQRLIEAITGGLQGPARALQLQIAFQALNKAFAEGEKPASDLNKLLEDVGNTGQIAFSRLDASFKVYLSTLASASWVTDFLSGLADGYERLNQAQLFRKETGGVPFADFSGSVPTPDFQNWLSFRENRRQRQDDRAALYMPPTKGEVALPEPPAFGGFQTFPKGQDWDQFKALVKDYETKLADVPGYKVDRQQIAFLDEQSKQFRYLLADTNAIRFATEEQRKLMAEQITGVFNIPDSGRALVAFYALSQGYVPRDRADALGAGAMDFPKAKDISDPITTAVYTVNDTLVTWASQFAAARDAYGGKQGGAIQKADPLDVYNQYLPNVGTPKAGQEMHARQVNAQRLPRPQSFVEEFAETHNLPVMRERHTPSQRAPQLSIPITINSRIVVNVDGRRIQQQINRQTYQQFSQIAGGAGVASGSSVL